VRYIVIEAFRCQVYAKLSKVLFLLLEMHDNASSCRYMSELFLCYIIEDVSHQKKTSKIRTGGLRTIHLQHTISAGDMKG
jgi:hypothetical protein